MKIGHFSQVIKMEYAVRGPLVIRATEIEKEIQKVEFRNLIPIKMIPLLFEKVRLFYA